MRRHVRLSRPQLSSRSHRQAPRFAATPRRLARSAAPTLSRSVARTSRPAVRREIAVAPRPDLGAVGFQPNPYVDYGRLLTPEGGVLITYKGIDDRWRHTLWRILAWSVATFVDGYFVFQPANAEHKVLSLFCLLVAAIINWLIVRKPVEVYRRIEIRPDCMIIDGADIFWVRQMEGGCPAFRPDSKGNQVLGGIYGTRFVEYLTVPVFDKLDRAPQVFAAHLQEAMNQLWMRPT
jgi:hypothetical protein